MNILSIDGGGIRGIIPGQVLLALEHKLQQISNDPNRRIADVFDFVAGTSTGGILACLYLCPDANGRPKFSASDAVNLYLQRGDDIFDVSVFRSRVFGPQRQERRCFDQWSVELDLMIVDEVIPEMSGCTLSGSKCALIKKKLNVSLS